MKLAVVVQRYGEAVNGGAELHARYIAEHLARHAEVEVLTTFATDYVTWRNESRPSHERINGIAVRRFPVARERDLLEFGRWSASVFTTRHSIDDELHWLDAEGPTTPDLVNHLTRHGESYDFCLFFSYRYYQAYYGARAVPARAVLIPTAERDPAIGLSIFQPIFRGVRALMYNSPEEEAMIQAVSGNRRVPGVVVGVGSEVPSDPQPERFRQRHGVDGPFAIYVGRIDENKGCKELFAYFERYLRDTPDGRLSLLLTGQSLLPIPRDARVRHLGFLSDEDKFDAMAAAEIVVVPSYFESLSMVTLEAWALGRPVLANGNCDVLKGQCLRSGAGLYYESGQEFLETIRALEKGPRLRGALGASGREFFRQLYAWPVIERKYLDVLAHLGSEPSQGGMEPLPSWLTRRRRNVPAGADVMAGLPRGPVAATADARAIETGTRR